MKSGWRHEGGRWGWLGVTGRWKKQKIGERADEGMTEGQWRWETRRDCESKKSDRKE